MAKKLSPTLKAVQQSFFEEHNVSVKAVANRKTDKNASFPDTICFVADGNEATHQGLGIYKYTKSQTKLGLMVQLYIEQINHLKETNLLK